MTRKGKVLKFVVGAEKHFFLIMMVKLHIVLRNVRKKRKNLETEGAKK